MSRIRDSLRTFIDPRPARVRSHHIRNGAILIAILLLVTFSAATRNIPILFGEPGQPVRVEFSSANQVDKNTLVRVNGVDVGEVEKIEAGSDPRRASTVTLRILEEGVKVHRDARAEIRWKTLLGGEMYIDLHPGSPDAPELKDAVIATSRTSSQVELDDVLQPYDGTTEQAQRGTLKGLSEGFGDPRATRRAVEALPALGTVEQGMRPLRGQASDDVRALVASTAKTVDALGQDTGQLQGLVSGANRTLAATARQRAPLGELVELSPPTLDRTRTTLRRVRTTLDHLDPLAAELRPGARQLAPARRALEPALDQTDALLDELRPVLRTARPTFASLQRLGDRGTPLLRELDPTVQRVDSEVIPFLNTRDDETKLRTYEAIGPFFASAGGAGAEFDARGHRFRLSVPAGSNSGVALVGDDMARSCRQSVPAARRSKCGALSKVLAQGWFGREKKR